MIQLFITPALVRSEPFARWRRRRQAKLVDRPTRIGGRKTAVCDGAVGEVWRMPPEADPRAFHIETQEVFRQTRRYVRGMAHEHWEAMLEIRELFAFAGHVGTSQGAVQFDLGQAVLTRPVPRQNLDVVRAQGRLEMHDHEAPAVATDQRRQFLPFSLHVVGLNTDESVGIIRHGVVQVQHQMRHIGGLR